MRACRPPPRRSLRRPPSVIGLVVILVLSSRATKRLRAVGIKVGFLGTKLPVEPPPGFLTDAVSEVFS